MGGDKSVVYANAQPGSFHKRVPPEEGETLHSSRQLQSLCIVIITSTLQRQTTASCPRPLLFKKDNKLFRGSSSKFYVVHFTKNIDE